MRPSVPQTVLTAASAHLPVCLSACISLYFHKFVRFCWTAIHIFLPFHFFLRDACRFAEKRVGYLGLTLLLDESSEVSMLSTNSLKQDLQHTNQYISSLALSALANGSPREVCRALLPEVESLLSCSNPFIRKKAAVAAAKCVRRLGDEAVSCFASTLPVLATDRSHGVLLGACALLFAVLETQPDRRVECRQQLLQPLAKALRTCSSASHPQSAEYDIAGIVDPLLQSRLLRAVALLAEVRYKPRQPPVPECAAGAPFADPRTACKTRRTAATLFYGGVFGIYTAAAAAANSTAAAPTAVVVSPFPVLGNVIAFASVSQ